MAKVKIKCQTCAKPFHVSDRRKDTAKYCCHKCASIGQTGPRKEVECKSCGKPFLAKKDHGAWEKFCNRSCFLADAIRPELRRCECCGKKFLAKRSGSTKRLAMFCSPECKHQAATKKTERNCLNCGKSFYLTDSAIRQRNGGKCCSRACHASYFSDARSHAYVDGTHITSQTGELFLLNKRDGYSGKYMGVHRIVAEKAIGRRLRRDEPVIRLDRDHQNNRPDNLFICGSISEMRGFFNGTIEWPNESNLLDYK